MRARAFTKSARIDFVESQVLGNITICEILDQLRLEITYQYAINHIDPYEGRNNIVRAEESGYLPIRIGGRVRIPYDINTSTRIEVRLEDSHIYVRRA